MALSWSVAQPAPSFGFGKLRTHLQRTVDKVTALSRRPAHGIKVKRPAFINLMGSLATMLDSGVPLYRALHHLAQNAETVEAAQLALAMMRDLERGNRLSKAAARHPRTFSPLHTGLLKVGETTGSLTLVLKQIVEFEEKSEVMARKLRTALTYPALVLFLCTLGLALAPPFLLEPHFQLIRELGVQPPLLTRILMLFSSLMLTPYPYLLLLGGGVFAYRSLSLWFKPRTRRVWLTKKLLRLPKVGGMLQTLLTSRFSRALSVQMQAGVPILDALHLAGKATANPYTEELADQAVSKMLRGRTLSAALKSTEFFSPMFLSVVRSGEETGQVAELISWLADLGDADLDQALESVISMLEPLIMAGVGLVVGTMVVATLLPLSTALDAL